MPGVNRSALVPYSAVKMFELVNDVAQYPRFLPGCSDVKIHHQDDSSMEASLLISKAGVRQWFTTSNKLRAGEYIQMNLKDGPFKKLSGGWVFIPLDTNACKIELNLEFEFSSRVVEMAFGRIFSGLANNMVKAFTDRAKEVYGD